MRGRIYLRVSLHFSSSNQKTDKDAGWTFSLEFMILLEIKLRFSSQTGPKKHVQKF